MRHPEKPVILRRSDYIGSIRSDISDLRQFITDAGIELATIEERISFSKEQKLKGFRSLLKIERRCLRKRIKRAERSIKELQILLVIAEHNLG